MMIVRANAPFASCSVRSTSVPGYRMLPRSSDTIRTIGREMASGLGLTAWTIASSKVSSTTSVPTGYSPSRLMNAFTITGSKPRRGLSRIPASTAAGDRGSVWYARREVAASNPSATATTLLKMLWTRGRMLRG